MRQLLFCVLAALVAGCSTAPGPESAEPRAAGAEARSRPSIPGGAPVLVAFGDSLTAGYGLAPDDSYPSILQDLLATAGTPYRVVNEGVSGDTTATALARVDGTVTHDAKLVIVAIGANDGLRGLPVTEMETNLREIVRRFQTAGRPVALAGIRIPPNMGPEYVSEFEAVYPRVAADLDVPLLPFLLEGVAADSRLNQDDGIHPNETGAKIVAQLVADFVTPLLADLGANTQ